MQRGDAADARERDRRDLVAPSTKTLRDGGASGDAATRDIGGVRARPPLPSTAEADQRPGEPRQVPGRASSRIA
jgi:hypothetical protein